jgi:ankyrin repeat protein
MHIAARVGHEGVVDALLREGADPNATNARGDTALHCACSRRHLRTVQRLLRGGAKIDSCNNAGTAPCDAAQAGWILSMLVDTGILKRVPQDVLGPDRLGDSDFG